MKTRVFQIVFFFFCCGGCVERFMPSEVANSTDYLVVDGFFNAGYDTSTITLSRTQGILDPSSTMVMEVGASVTVESHKGRVLTFRETDKGVYRLLPQFVDQQDQYRIRIKTRTGQTYLSDYYTTVISPGIDSITYSLERMSEGITLKVTTRNRPDAERFYRWYYEDTWEYWSALVSRYEVINRGTSEAAVIPRTEDIHACWKSDKSKKIMIASTAKQSENLLQEHSLDFIPTVSGKMVTKYSVLLHQHAISREAFEYWTALSKTTETTGSIFDPVPTSVTGNIKNVENREEPVFGFFTACVPTEKRYFLPERFGMAITCKDTLVTEEYALTIVDSLIAGAEIYPGYPIHYRIAHFSCLDCRVFRGTNVMPSFWK
jgi:hypothetical protein